MQIDVVPSNNIKLGRPIKDQIDLIKHLKLKIRRQRTIIGRLRKQITSDGDNNDDSDNDDSDNDDSDDNDGSGDNGSEP
jgi:hypothetical protein